MGKWGGGGLGHRGPVTKCKKFHKQKPGPGQRKRQGSTDQAKPKPPRKRTEIFWGLDGLVNVY